MDRTPRCESLCRDNIGSLGEIPRTLVRGRQHVLQLRRAVGGGRPRQALLVAAVETQHTCYRALRVREEVDGAIRELPV